ncbi:hypothetical protein HK099_001584 [Clydaea vesicula]|uniref:Bystin n=1 Tax=Clydaea vesicula TaxID=447962 RepID=A0AAD5U3C5_9FUNG|nr:hypothetical protein HK099_001584 [Clydaea vesicula]KAJ3397147.1 hypothetical protein HDU92_000452 [Lobulomyces angularis]
MPKITKRSGNGGSTAELNRIKLGPFMSEESVKKKKELKQKKNQQSTESNFVDSKTTRKILNLVKDQQNEVLEEVNGTVNVLENYGFNGNQGSPRESDIEEEIYEDDNDLEIDDLDLDAKEMEILEKFMNKEPKKQLNLSNLLLEKLNKNKEQSLKEQIDTQDKNFGLNEKVVEVYTKVGLLLSRYRSGKLPKTFKIIPSLENWEQILSLTTPEKWTPHATYQATRVFTSNLKAHLATNFFKMVLLERVREDISENKNLNYHLYMSLKKALYKPAAFYKGIIVPLCESGDCTLREAVIIGSVITKVSIPMLHSAAALMKIAEMEYTGANSLFIRVLLDKKYALPYKVIDALVFHFLRLRDDPRGPMPVLWHQSLLVFAQRYKEDMTREQKDSLIDLCKYQIHPAITAEVRRELVGGVERDHKEVKSMDMTF